MEKAKGEPLSQEEKENNKPSKTTYMLFEHWKKVENGN